MSIARSFALAALFIGASLAPAAAANPLILQSPTVSRTQIAFVYGGDIWIVGHDGGTAHRIVTGFGLAGAPYFSPDGSTIAFSANYDGSTNIYTVPASGGEPTRLTYHPGADVVIGWTTDGSKILFSSHRESQNDATQLYTIPRGGGIPTMLPLPDAQCASYSPDGTHLAYVPNSQWEWYWQEYRGGQTTPIWIANLADSSVTSIPRNNSNDRFPMWIGNQIYFVSDRDGGITRSTTTIRARATSSSWSRIRADWISSRPRRTTARSSTRSSIRSISTTRRRAPIARSDLDRRGYARVAPELDSGRERNPKCRHLADRRARGVRSARRHPYGPGGERLDSQSYANPERHGARPSVVARRQVDRLFLGCDRRVHAALEGSEGLAARARHPARCVSDVLLFAVWAPDSKKIAYADKHGVLYYIDIAAEHPQPVKFAQQPHESFGVNPFDAAWSPDSRYLAYNKDLPSSCTRSSCTIRETARRTKLPMA